MRFALGTVIIAIAAISTPAAATGITCDRQFQIVNGQKIATPFCADRLLGNVARERGIKVTDAQIRQSDNTKIDLCRRVGIDMRLRVICANYFPYPGSSD